MLFTPEVIFANNETQAGYYVEIASPYPWLAVRVHDYIYDFPSFVRYEIVSECCSTSWNSDRIKTSWKCRNCNAEVNIYPEINYVPRSSVDLSNTSWDSDATPYLDFLMEKHLNALEAEVLRDDLHRNLQTLTQWFFSKQTLEHAYTPSVFAALKQKQEKDKFINFC